MPPLFFAIAEIDDFRNNQRTKFRGKAEGKNPASREIAF
jgi:hypothetical protein